MNHTPPTFAERLLTWFLKDEIAEEVLGDLEEKFELTIEERGLARAKINYWFQAINYLRPFALKSIITLPKFNPMLRQNLRVSTRIILKHKAFSAINIGGLALGMIVTMLVSLWVYDELSFNTNYENYDRIVQVLRKDVSNGETEVGGALVSKVSVFLSENYDHIFDEVFMTFNRNNPQILSVKEETFELSGYFVEPSAPSILTLEMIAGSAEGLSNPSSMLISEATAKSFFGSENPIGQSVTLNLSTDLLVAGVFKSLPDNATFSDARFFASMNLIYNESNPRGWGNYNMKVYATLADGVAIENASAAIADVMKPHRDPEDGSQELFLLPMEDWHLRSEFKGGEQVTSRRMNFVQLFGAIGLFVLILACINFMNLNTSQFHSRAKEVGVRKVIGSRRGQLVFQFLTESLLYSLFALVLSLLVVWIVLPAFNTLAAKSIIFPWQNLWFWIGCLLFPLATALLAGSYPALSLSSYQPIKALKGSVTHGNKASFFRQVLVVFQFSVSILLIIGTVTIFQQMEHGKSRPVGYNQSHLITLRGYTGDYYRKHELLRNTILQTGAAVEVASANYPLMNTLGNNGGFSLEGSDQQVSGSFNTIYVTPEYGKATQWELIAGRDFSRNSTDESSNIIISELAAEKLGLDDPIGKRINSIQTFNDKNTFTVVGVVRDMIKGSPFEEPVPLMLFHSSSSPYLFIRLNENMPYQESLAAVEEAFGEVLPNHPMNYEFIDMAYANKFGDEEKVSNMAALFTGLAVMISCLGLFGLAAYVVEQRTKEIGIRKILGANTGSLWMMLSKGFGSLVLIASILAVPIGAYILNDWLANYSYRIEIPIWLYLLSCLSALVIALLTISYHTFKVALSNPVNSLRSE